MLGFWTHIYSQPHSVQYKSKDVITTIKRAMNHDYVVGAYNTGSHWVSFPLRKFKDVVTIVNW